MHLKKHLEAVECTDLAKVYGKVTQVIGLVIHGIGISASIGDLCIILTGRKSSSDMASLDSQFIPAEVVGFVGDEVLLMPLGEIHGVKPADRIISTNKPLGVWVGDQLLGRTLDALGEPIDGGSPLFGMASSSIHDRNDDVYEAIAQSAGLSRRPIHNTPPDPFLRKRISEPLSVGIRAIDGLITCGKGQRIGIFAGSGVGKSVLLGMIARNTTADVNVISLVGERGREVRDFIERDLGEEGMARSVVVVATSDKSPLLRSRGPSTAMAIAEYFRDQGKDVLLMMDSVTRYAMAEREIGLAIGEPPTTKGYTPSVFAKLPKLLERAGTTEKDGTITGLYTVLVEADDMNDPIGDSVRSILDGHIVLSRELAVRNHYPAIEVTHSISRLMVEIISPEHRKAANLFKETLAIYNDAKDLIDLGAYTQGSSPQIDYAIAHINSINAYLRQQMEESSDFASTVSILTQLLPDQVAQAQ